MIKGVIFDLWNTLITPDNNYHTLTLIQDIHKIDHGEYKLHIYKPLMTEKIGDVVSLSYFLKDNFGLRPFTDEEEERIVRQVKIDGEAVSLNGRVEETLQYLKERNIKIGLISNATTFHKDPFYSLGIDKYFDYATFSCDTGFWKPDPEIYAHTLKQLGLKPSEVMMVGDNLLKDAQIPTKYGMIGTHLSENSNHEHSIKTIDELIGHEMIPEYKVGDSLVI